MILFVKAVVFIGGGSNPTDMILFPLEPSVRNDTRRDANPTDIILLVYCDCCYYERVASIDNV